MVIGEQTTILGKEDSEKSDKVAMEKNKETEGGMQRQ